ncbi:hypothetical protein C8Q80DRAFT_1265368 [Daedaleopsis nitida]|nr:hypothetical protein C8Q80DRAFT_1265368 [Daedaleopsis nitida]
MVKFALIHAVALAFAVTVQAAVLVEPQGEFCAEGNSPVCQTSGGSPLVSDCQQAVNLLGASRCQQTNGWPTGSHCQTITKYGTCKIDACGKHNAQTQILCNYYLQDMLKFCQSNGLVGGQYKPTSCYVDPETDDYYLQFSHT